MERMMTIVELQLFLKNADRYLSDEELESFKDHIARNPESGAVMRGTGGVRKVRWATGNKGKSGGARIIYYFYDQSIPLFLITVYGKKDKASLTKAQQNAMKQLTERLKAYGDGYDGA
jgi:mRNA-degrading endonuclease RelE of RelBE toxin-antitoxin system